MKRRNNVKQYIWDARIDNMDPYKQVICPQCKINFNKGNGQGTGKAYCSRRCFTRARKNNRVK